MDSLVYNKRQVISQKNQYFYSKNAETWLDKGVILKRSVFLLPKLFSVVVNYESKILPLVIFYLCAFANFKLLALVTSHLLSLFS